MGPYLYRIAFQPLSEASILVLLIAAVGAHFSMTGLCLLFFGPEGLRAKPLLTGELHRRAAAGLRARASPSTLPRSA